MSSWKFAGVIITLVTTIALLGCTSGRSSSNSTESVTRRSASEQLLIKTDSTDPASPQKLVFSPDEKRFAYMVGGYGAYVVVDGKKGKHYDDVSDIIFSPDSKRVAYTARIGNKWVVVVDDKEGKQYDEAGRPQFSPDGKRLAYIARLFRGSNLNIEGSYLVVDEGVEGKQYDSVYSMTFSPDSTRLVYRAESRRKYFLVVNGVEGKDYTPTPYFQEIFFSPDGKHLAITAQSYSTDYGPLEFVILDDIEGNKYSSVSKPTFSSDGNHMAYLARIRQDLPPRQVIAPTRQFFVVDGIEGEQVNGEVKEFALSRDGKRLAYVLQGQDGHYSIVVDGVEGKHYVEIGRTAHDNYLVFSPDGQHLVYVAAVAADSTGSNFGNKNWLVVLDGIEGKPYNDIGEGMRRLPSFSPDSQHLMYLALSQGNPNSILVVDGSERTLEGSAHSDTPVFSPDSKHIAYVASVSHQEVGPGELTSVSSLGTFVFVDGTKGKPYFGINSLSFDSAERIHYLAWQVDAKRNVSYYLVEERLK